MKAVTEDFIPQESSHGLYGLRTDQSTWERPQVEHVQPSCTRPHPVEKPVTKLELSVEWLVSTSVKSMVSFLNRSTYRLHQKPLSPDACSATAYILCDSLTAIEAIDKKDVCKPPLDPLFEVVWLACRHLNTKTAVLHFTLCRTGSRWSSCSSGVMLSNFLVPVTRRAAAFWRDRSLSTRWALTPTSSWLQ